MRQRPWGRRIAAQCSAGLHGLLGARPATTCRVRPTGEPNAGLCDRAPVATRVAPHV